MTVELTLGFSPCPNDTFMFYPLVHGLVDTEGLSYRERLEDVETLNLLALAGELDVSKVSYHALGHIRDDYALLRAGSALGRGCGPLLVAADRIDPAGLRGRTIAVPGRYTTAKLLLRLFDPALDTFIVMPFNEIMDAVLSGSVDAGLIIHESRFTYRERGLHKLLDLGEWWEGETGTADPAGGYRGATCAGCGNDCRHRTRTESGGRACPEPPGRGVPLHRRTRPGNEPGSLRRPHRAVRQRFFGRPGGGRDSRDYLPAAAGRGCRTDSCVPDAALCLRDLEAQPAGDSSRTATRQLNPHHAELSPRADRQCGQTGSSHLNNFPQFEHFLNFPSTSHNGPAK